ncbi:hypothetical protein DTO013E5_3802 [Penicillium roqueforti]|nr:hypothetical protein DTO013F2_6787 [Penicillium roqueforti]KAI2747959.1 hypothetical protein DTO012A1_605 [Penicillium roqueforti]KAI2772905.1 hypothetical protein DTO012A8_2544 [Penicillium roqueforti]KAI3081668.1 hypothetical protein CBS147339_2986 [Penicillium roqueforti]KAI3095862.1 hypothetical protein CBS147338_5536 [Penicillium roqueforti]
MYTTSSTPLSSTYSALSLVSNSSFTSNTTKFPSFVEPPPGTACDTAFPMESVRQSCRPKHQVLTLKCYPKYQKGVSEVRPNSSELSYLLYYTSTRRSKLTKVCGFLEKRVARDVWRRRIGNVQVALHILAAIIEKVPRDLPIYARSVMTVIDTILRSNDINMVEESIVTFEMFCRYQDIAAIAADQSLAHQYREVVRTYTGLADPGFTSNANTDFSPQVAIRWRNAGLRAIRAVVSSETLTADGGTLLKLCLPVILKNLYSEDENLLITLKEKLSETEANEREPPKPRRMSVNTVHTVDVAEGDPELAAQSAAEADRKAEMDARVLALRCLEQTIASGSNRGQIRIVVTVILQFISRKGFPQSEKRGEITEGKCGNWATSLIDLIANWCPVQVRFIILITAMEILHDTTPKEDALQSSFTILSVVDSLLKSSVNMIGLSVMDVLYGLMHYASEILSPSERTGSADGEKKNRQAEIVVQISPQRQDLLTLLEQSIGDLATHIYYGDQVEDMMRAILRRFKPHLHHDSSSPSTLATVQESGVTHEATSDEPETNGDKASTETFSHAAAKLTALRAVKAILVVANSKTLATMSGVESRHSVGIHVWEGTQVLLRDVDRDVRYAYSDAFLSWLQIETNGNDLKVRLDSPKYIKTPKKDTEQMDRPTRRGSSVPATQRDKVALVAQSNFLRLLHLAIYDAAIEAATEEAEILLLHLLLANLVENLGVNAAQFGVPMVFKLQDDLFTSMDLSSFAARVNIGSLVHGYLLALSQHFDIQSSPVGQEISNEIQQRQAKGYWLSKIRLPPVDLHAIVFDSEKRSDNDSTSPPLLTPFCNVEGLVYMIEESYCKLVSSPPERPSSASSPARGFTFPVLGSTATVKSQVESHLPSVVKEQMLSPWSREACLAAVDKESTGTPSVSGSRATTNPRYNQTNMATNGSPAGSQYNRRMSIPEISGSSSNSSSRSSPVRVNELRRVLSVTSDSHDRRLSPLRGRLDASNDSSVSSGSESMMSGNFSVSEIDGDATSIRPESQRTPDDDGLETPRATPAAFFLSGDKAEDIPPVPPVPTGLSIPGGFPNDSQRSLASYDRPFTAPAPSGPPARDRADANALNYKPLNRNKSRSNHSLATSGIPELLTDYETNDLNGNHQDQLRKLLDGFLSPNENKLTNGSRPATAISASKALPSRSSSTRRSGGLGRPPY